ncbi:uncharacterized protein LOC126100466 [Schistocerca cancellata]|uniref:uncharacterized protein LOC126100466 n=1 Tax=Schistocerca cancellata TaxID=274614 RepID=UPI002119A90F|nr:uncharacterized protein LOC126100466 [Schistocerca cancellata]XP_049767031.1 uncharacterized protein LOC126100466 [Schistocerca cancellata]
MALLNKIFSSRKKNQKQGYVSFGKNESVSWKPFSFSKDQVRVILFRECDWRGRKLLFDSETVQKIAIETQQVKTKFGSKQKSDKKKKNEAFVEITNGFGYQYLRPNQDVTVMGEMIFGSVAMSFKGTAFKVHALKSPDRLMCTKVFQSPGAGHRTKKISDHSLEDSYSSSISSVSDGTLGLLSSSSDLIAGKPGSGPLDVPSADLHTKAQYSSLEADSGFCGDASLQSPSSISSVGYWPSYTGSIASRNSSGSVDGVSGGSLASLRRRWLRSVSTSLEVACSASSGLFSSRNSSSSETSSSVGTNQRRTKLGLAVAIALSSGQEKDMETFLLEHMAILESVIERLQLAVDRAYLRKDMFVHLMMEAWEDLCQWLEGLFSAPRPSCPLWMGLGMAPTHLHTNLAYGFLQDLCHLIAALDTKSNNFFVSTLITAVLTHHLGWVATVMPNKNTCKSASRNCCSSQLLNSLSRSHPYSALWAQLGDLSGAISSPTKVSRTIVTSSSSKQTDLVGKIVSCLTYFIRCGALEKHSNISLPSEICASDAQCVFDGSPLASMKSSAVSVSTLTEATNELHLKGTVDDFHKPSKALHKPADYMLAAPFNVSKYQLSEKSVNIAMDDNISDSKVAESEEAVQKKGVARELFKLKSAAKFSCEMTAGNMCSPARAEWDNHEVSNLAKKCDSDSSPAPVITYSQVIASDSTPEPDVQFHRALSTESSRTLTENSTHSPVSLCGMKRSTSFCNRMTSSLAGAASVSSQLHPTTTTIEVLEDSVNNNALHPEVISEKVNRLCRIPTEAVMYHLQKEYSEPDDSSRLLERVSCERQMSAADTSRSVFPPQTPVPSGKFDSMVSFESHINNTSYDCIDEPDSGIDSHIGSANTKSENVIFVLGDNEELVGLKNNNHGETRTSHLSSSHQEVDKPVVSAVDSNGNIKSTDCDKFPSNCPNSKSNFLCRDSCSCTGFTQLVEQERSKKHGYLDSQWKSLCNSEICKIGNRFLCSNSILGCESECKTSRKSLSCNDSPFVIPSVKTDCGADDSQRNWDPDRVSLIDSNCEGRIVMVHSSYIELEDEGDCRESRCKTVIRPSKPVTRSQSLSFPLCKKPSSKQSSICRRHSEYVHHNERYLKNYHSVRFNFERCESVLNNYVDGTGQEKTPEEDEINGARENFENLKSLSEDTHCRQCGSDKVTSVNVSLKCSLCECKHSETCDSDTPSKCRTVDSRPAYVDTDTSREGNALFDEYSALSDEDVVTPTGNMASSVKDDENCQHNLDPFENKTFLELPFPSSRSEDSNLPVGSGMAASLLGGVTDHYLPDLILHGCIQPVRAWESALRRDLALSARHPPVDQEVSEAVCIVANTDTWDVQLLSSHAYVTDRPGTLGVHVGMSQLVANMLESLLLLWRLHTPVDQCLKHVESKLRELYLRSQAVAEMLLSVDFCDVATLTSALGLEANDIPLLLAVASTHSPQVTQRYGVSFR